MSRHEVSMTGLVATGVVSKVKSSYEHSSCYQFQVINGDHITYCRRTLRGCSKHGGRNGEAEEKRWELHASELKSGIIQRDEKRDSIC